MSQSSSINIINEILKFLLILGVGQSYDIDVEIKMDFEAQIENNALRCGLRLFHFQNLSFFSWTILRKFSNEFLSEIQTVT